MLTDEELFQNYETKTEIRLLEIEGLLVDVELKISESTQTVRELEEEIMTQECFEVALHGLHRHDELIQKTLSWSSILPVS